MSGKIFHNGLLGLFVHNYITSDFKYKMGKSTNLLCNRRTLIDKMAKEGRQTGKAPMDLQQISGSLQKPQVFIKHIEQHVSGAYGKEPLFLSERNERK